MISGALNFFEGRAGPFLSNVRRFRSAFTPLTEGSFRVLLLIASAIGSSAECLRLGCRLALWV